MIPTSPVLFWQYFDFISVGVLVLVVGMLIVLHKIKYGSLESTISKTIAKQKSSRVIFSVVMTLFFPLYYACIYFWVGPSFHMPFIFYALLLFSAICELIFVWVPAIGKTEKIHTIAAGLVGLGMVVLVLLVLLYGHGLILIGIIAACFFILFTIFIAFTLYLEKLKRYSFLLELTYCIVFLITISIIAHT